MYQSQNSNRFSQSQQVEPALSQKIDMLCLIIIVIGFFSCLIRSDYNLAVIFFCYFVWQQRKDHLGLKIIMVAVIVLILIDIIFAFTELRVWVSEDPNNPIWQTLRPMHNFGIFCFSLIMILKIILLVFVCKGNSKFKNASSQPY